jgi:hypothetical protein
MGGSPIAVDPVQLVATSGGASSPAWDRLSQIAQQRKAQG